MTAQALEIMASHAGNGAVRGPRVAEAAFALSPRATLRYSRSMQSLLLVFVGAGAGGALRYLVNIFVAQLLGVSFPYGTMLINVSGSLVMGLLVGALALRADADWSQEMRLLIGTGVLGGYTTFSTFSLESVQLIERNQFGAAMLYIGGSVALGVAGLWAGLALMRSWG